MRERRSTVRACVPRADTHTHTHMRQHTFGLVGGAARIFTIHDFGFICTDDGSMEFAYNERNHSHSAAVRVRCNEAKLDFNLPDEC